MTNQLNLPEKYLHQKVNASVFLICLCVLFLSFFLMPTKQISENEKRSLAKFPIFQTKHLLSGVFMDSVDLYFSDHYPWRDNFIKLSNSFVSLRGFSNTEITYYSRNANTKEVEKRSPVADSSLSKNIPEEVLTDEKNLDFETIKSVVVYNKRAIQIFSGSSYGAKNYAGLINNFKKTFGNSVNIYCMPVPVGADFYLPQKINKQKEKEFINDIFSQLQQDVIKVNAYDQLAKHKSEYIQFNTDHHWTGRGAYYAYVAFCNSAGIQPLSLNSFQKRVIPNFLGTLYYYTLSKQLKNNTDSVEYFKIPVKTKTFFTKNGVKNEQPCQLYAEYAKGSNAYGVFLGGDFPVMRVNSDLKNGRKVLILKDSYGNAFSPYLASHFEEVYIIDFRYFTGSIKELVKSKNITDIVFGHNVYVANSNYAVKKEMNMLRGSQELKNELTSNARKDTLK